MGGGPTTHTETSSVTLPDWYTEGMKSGVDAAGKILKPGFEGAGPAETPLAGLTSQHGKYAEMIDGLTGGANRAGGAATAGRMGYGAMPFATSVGYTDPGTPAAMVNRGHIEAMANPFSDMVSRAVNDRIDKQNDRAASQIGGRAATRGAFAGSGSQEAVERSLLAEDTMDQKTEAEAQLRTAAYDRATDAAFKNAGIMTDALSRTQNVALNNTANFNNAMTRAAQTMLSAGQLDMQGQGAADGMEDSYVDRIMKIAGGQKGVGDMFQNHAQKDIDQPLTQLDRYLAILNGGQLPTTTTGTKPLYDNNGGLWGTLAMLAGAIL